VVALKAETDGDLHIELQDATGDKLGIVIVEEPEKPQWCEIRNTVFSWTSTQFPFHTSSAKKLTLNQTPVVTVIGKAFFDIGHSLKSIEKSEKKSSRLRCVGNSPCDEPNRSVIERVARPNR